MSVERTYTSYV